MTIHIRRPWERHRSITKFEGESCTDTSAGNDTDVNHIVARFARTGALPKSETQPFFGDVTHLQGDLTTMIENGKNALNELEKLKQQSAVEQPERQPDDSPAPEAETPPTPAPE